LIIVAMRDRCRLIWCAVAVVFWSRGGVASGNPGLATLLNVLRCRSPKRVTLSHVDRLVFTGLYRLAPGVVDALKILQPETVIRWHRAGFRSYWRWESGPAVADQEHLRTFASSFAR